MILLIAQDVVVVESDAGSIHAHQLRLDDGGSGLGSLILRYVVFGCGGLNRRGGLKCECVLAVRPVVVVPTVDELVTGGILQLFLFQLQEAVLRLGGYPLGGTGEFFILALRILVELKFVGSVGVMLSQKAARSRTAHRGFLVDDAGHIVGEVTVL